jgi:holo-[acyl-carrier protein] synthase
VKKAPNISVGVDIIEIDRIEQAASSWRNAFLQRIYTDAELKSSNNRASSLAARFAAKEAVMKALGTGMIAVGWKEIEILSNSDGSPLVHLHGGASNRAKEIGLSRFSLSLSHSKDYAVAMVVGYAE